MAKQARRFVYQRRDSETVKTRSNARGGNFDSILKEGIKVFKPREGKNTIRILPPAWPSARHYGYDIHVNYGIGVDDQAYLSLSAMKNERDPLAEGRKEAEREGNKKLADSLKPSHRVGFFLIDRMAEDEGVQFWMSPWTVDRSFCGISVDEDTGAAIAVDAPFQTEDYPEDGCDIRFYKEGTGMTTKYPAEKMRVLKPSPLSEDEGLAQQWLDYVAEHPIPEILNYYDYDHIASVFEGHTVKDDDDEGNNRARKVTPKATPKGSSIDQDEVRPRKTAPRQVVTDGDEVVDDETGEVTTKPSNGRATRRTPEPDEDDNEAAEASMSVESIRNRLAGRRPRSSVEED